MRFLQAAKQGKSTLDANWHSTRAFAGFICSISQTCFRCCRCSAAASAGVSDVDAARGEAAADAQPASGAQGQPRLQLYNSMSRSKEPFTARPDQGNSVSMYVCGVTVYSMSHVGASSLIASSVVFVSMDGALGAGALTDTLPPCCHPPRSRPALYDAS